MGREWTNKTSEAAQGKWRGILLQLGVPDGSLTGRNVPCPMCGGTDRFMFDNKEGRGTWICRQACGAGDGMDLAIAFTGKPFADVARDIDQIIGRGDVKADPVRREMTTEEQQQAIRSVAALTQEITEGDVVDRYLHSRGLGEITYPPSLRFIPALRDGEGGVRPAMVASVKDRMGKTISLHRTFLKSDGSGKAEMASPRKLMPGPLPDGACVRLGDVGDCLGVAEGIETALAASARFHMPVWAALNSSMLSKWEPPDDVTEVVIFGDNDPKFGGQAAAYTLAHRLAVREGMIVSVQIPDMPGTDWLDVYLIEQKS